MPSIRMGDWVPTGNVQNTIWKKSLCGTIRDACRERAYAAVFAWKNAGSHGNRVREEPKMINFSVFCGMSHTICWSRLKGVTTEP